MDLSVLVNADTPLDPSTSSRARGSVLLRCVCWVQGDQEVTLCLQSPSDKHDFSLPDLVF